MNITKLLLLKFLLLATVWSSAQANELSVNIFVAHAPGGGMAITQQLIAEGLKEKGWKVNYVILGNCGSAKEKLSNKDELSVVGYVASWLVNPTHTCYLDVNDQNFAGAIYKSYYWLCGPKDDLDFSLKSGNRYRLAINRGSPDIPVIDELAKKLGINITYVEYTNSGSITQAFAAKEVDLTFTTSGLSMMEKKQAKCFYSTWPTTQMGVQPLNTVVKSKLAHRNFSGFLVVNNKTHPNYKRLEKDIRDIKLSAAFQTASKKRQNEIVVLPIDKELQELKTTVDIER